MDGDPTLSGKLLGGRFRLGDPIGEGAMATVYRGFDQVEGDREVAIKIMHPHLARDEQFGKRFRREARAAKKLDHPNTVRVFDYGVDGAMAFIAMELLGGEDLESIIRRERILSSTRAAALIAQVASALGSAHRLGIVHRDLKPGNVMVLPPGDGRAAETVKVLDFGIAKVGKMPSKLRGDMTGSDSALTVAGMALGTPEYMSPEQCRGVEVDFRSDIYACGVLLYELCTGRVPFRADIHVETMLMQVRDAPKLPRQLVPEVDPRLEHVIMTALSKSPSGRQQSTHELEASLLRIAASPAEASPVSAHNAQLLRDDPGLETAPTLVASAVRGEPAPAPRLPMPSSPYFERGAPELIPVASAREPSVPPMRTSLQLATIGVLVFVIAALVLAIVVLVAT